MSTKEQANGRVSTTSTPAKNSGLQMIACGLPRTGTTSIALALAQLLDGPVLDVVADTFVRGTRADQDDLIELGSISPGDPRVKPLLKKILTGHTQYVATTDFPLPLYMTDLLELYPDLMCVCTTRDFKGWYKSFTGIQRTFKKLAPWAFAWGRLKRCIQHIDDAPARMRAVYGEDVVPPSMALIGAPILDEDFGRKMFDAHHEFIRRVVPEKQLLMFDVREGWQPLCEFLGKEVPTVREGEKEVAQSFPHKYSASNVQEYGNSTLRFLKTRVALVVLGGGMALGLAMYLAKYRN